MLKIFVLIISTLMMLIGCSSQLKHPGRTPSSIINGNVEYYYDHEQKVYIKKINFGRQDHLLQLTEDDFKIEKNRVLKSILRRLKHEREDLDPIAWIDATRFLSVHKKTNKDVEDINKKIGDLKKELKNINTQIEYTSGENKDLELKKFSIENSINDKRRDLNDFYYSIIEAEKKIDSQISKMINLLKGSESSPANSFIRAILSEMKFKEIDD